MVPGRAADRRCPGFERGFTLNKFVHDSSSAAAGRLVDLNRSEVAKRLMGPFSVVELEILCQAQLQPENVDIPFQVHILVLDAAPEPFRCGRPKMLYLDNGPIAKSRVFQNVMDRLDITITWKTHLPAGKDGRRVTARSKGKVERPFRTVKDARETLYHFHKPENEAEANQRLFRYLSNYNQQKHRIKEHTRMEDWLTNLPSEGVREMCSWERFSTFAREPKRRKVGIDARVSIDGTTYEVDSGLAGETVILLWGLFDV